MIQRLSRLFENRVAASVEIHHGGKKRSYSNYSYKLGHLSRVVFIARCTEKNFYGERIQFEMSFTHSLCNKVKESRPAPTIIFRTFMPVKT